MSLVTDHFNLLLTGTDPRSISVSLEGTTLRRQINQELPSKQDTTGRKGCNKRLCHKRSLIKSQLSLKAVLACVTLEISLIGLKVFCGLNFNQLSINGHDCAVEATIALIIGKWKLIFAISNARWWQVVFPIPSACS